jgi:hypothetical protein
VRKQDLQKRKRKMKRGRKRNCTISVKRRR